MNDKAQDNWGTAAPYDRYVGRWSQRVAKEFIKWISVPVQTAWADIGCGTGALMECILAQCEPSSLAVSFATSMIIGLRSSVIKGLRQLIWRR